MGSLLTCLEMLSLQLVSSSLYCHLYKQINMFSFPMIVVIYEFLIILTQ